MCEKCCSFEQEHPEVIAARDATFASIHALDEEQKNVLIETLAKTARNLLHSAAQAPDTGTAQADLELLDTVINTIGYASAAVAEDHHDAEWFSEGDRRITAIIQQMQDIVRLAALTQLPDSIREKVANGTATPEEIVEAVKNDPRFEGAHVYVKNEDGEVVATDDTDVPPDTPNYGMYL